jgi:hypothetical protein
MTQDTIVEVGIDEEQRLFVTPSSMAFPHIWRAAMEVHWDDEQKRLHSPVPREWTYVDWFNQIIWAAADEYGVWLRLTPETVWSGISDDLRAGMIAGPLPPIASRPG